MDIDIGFWLTLLVLVSGLIWLADKRWKLADNPSRPIREVVEFSNSLLPVFLVVLIIRSFIIEPFKIPSGSMIPTLEVHDFILVNKFSYGLRLPVTNTLIVPLGEPERGDIMVFRYPVQPRQNFIKRVVGLPGDQVVQRDGELLINGEPVDRELRDRRTRGNLHETVYVEQLGDARYLARYEARVNPFTGSLMVNSEDGEWQIPEGNYFMVGDNRNNSSDSRAWGLVPESHIVGEAFLIWMHWPSLFSLPSFSRNGPIDKVEAE